ncbi:MAG: hypothetical protein IK015_09880 [Treponema sp.]|nr:hypothetical protein [Treponema sp.]
MVFIYDRLLVWLIIFSAIPVHYSCGKLVDKVEIQPHPKPPVSGRRRVSRETKGCLAGSGKKPSHPFCPSTPFCDQDHVSRETQRTFRGCKENGDRPFFPHLWKTCEKCGKSFCLKMAEPAGTVSRETKENKKPRS